jgi:Caspase domain
MRKFVVIALVCCSLLVMFSCSKSPTATGPTQERESITLVPRPEFIDTRPAEVIESSVLYATEEYSSFLQKKPPKPPPDTSSQDPNPNPAHKYAYIVGISNYEGTINDLQYCDDDARAMKAYLQGEGFTIMMDVDLNATANNIADGLQWLINQAGPDDEIAFCYSGHGAKAPGSGSSLISTDMYYMTHGYVMEKINLVNCSKKLVTLDCCVIGDFHRDAASGTYMATASNKTDSYDAPDLQQGAWTYFFLEAAEDLDYVFAEEIAPYAEAGMRAWASPYHLRVSPKHTDRYDGMFDI